MKYDIIYCDPPWKYGGDGGTKWLPAEVYYPTISFEDLKTLNVSEYTEKDCLLFMWVVSPELKRCIEVGESWGFKYVTVGFVWFKERANVGNYTMSSTELCLIFKKGKIPSDRVRNPGTLQFHSEAIKRHSEKPYEFRKRIEQMFPKSKKLEIFGRKKYDGWDIFGSGIYNDVILKFEKDELNIVSESTLNPDGVEKIKHKIVRLF